MTALAPVTAAPADARLAAFLNADAPEVFSAIVHGSQIWTADPFDVDSIHAPARTAYLKLLSRAASPAAGAAGKSLLLLGEAGSGKTHLMRAFRAACHSRKLGYCGYLQMTTRSDNYARYVLSNLIDALEQPYLHPAPQSGLSRLAHALVDALDILDPDEKSRLCDDRLEPAELAPLVHQAADLAVQYEQFAKVDIDLVRAILYLLSNDGRIRPRVLKWLRCEELSRYDRELLGDLVPRPQQEMPLRTVIGLGQLMAAASGAALVLCVDQLEEIIEQMRAAGGADQSELVRQALNTLIDITDALPSAVVVIACLEDLFPEVQKSLPKAKLDRLMRDPVPIRLSSKHSLEEVEAMIGKRLSFLYAGFGVATDTRNPAYPFSKQDLTLISGLRTRDMLDFCREHRERCQNAAAWQPLGHVMPSEAKPAAESVELEQRWNDFLANYAAPVMDDEELLAKLLAWGIDAVSVEIAPNALFSAEVDGRFVPVQVAGGERLLVAICDRNARGGGLGKQIDEVVERAGETPAVIVRSTAFPISPRAAVTLKLAELLEPKGIWRKVVVENSDWRCLAAFRSFYDEAKSAARFADWQQKNGVLSRLPALRAILQLDAWASRTVAPGHAESAPIDLTPPPPEPVQTPAPVDEYDEIVGEQRPMHLGVTRGADEAIVTAAVDSFKEHAAFLGDAASAATMAALSWLKQLLRRQIPVVVIERKGDWSRALDPAAKGPLFADPVGARLRDMLDLVHYAPGGASGRNITLPVVLDMSQTPPGEREQLAGQAAAALAGMMGYQSKGFDPKVAILSKAIEILAHVPGKAVTLKNLKQLVEDRDEVLVRAVEGFDDRHFRQLAEDLLTLCLQRERLLGGGPTSALDLDELFGQRAHARPDRVRLSIINTQHLRESLVAEFWMTQFLVAIERWGAKNPSPRLQAILLVDDADHFFPEGKQPTTKGPLENLLRSAPSHGVGIFLSTSTPAALDFRCRDFIHTWISGAIADTATGEKVRPLGIDPALLANLPKGQAVLKRGCDSAVIDSFM